MKLSRMDAEREVRALEGWSLNETAIVKQFVFKGFPEAVAFVSRLVAPAEAADHHPDVRIDYKRVTITYTTHSEGGLTMKDVAGARMADEAATFSE